MPVDSSSSVCQPGLGHHKTLVLEYYKGTASLLRCLCLVAADLYGANCIALGHPCFVAAAEGGTTDK